MMKYFEISTAEFDSPCECGSQCKYGSPGERRFSVEYTCLPLLNIVCVWIVILISLTACNGKRKHTADGVSKPEKPVVIEVFMRPDEAATNVTETLLPLAKKIKDYVAFRYYPIAPGSKVTGDPDTLPHRVVDDCGYHNVPKAKGYTYVSRTATCQKVPRDMSLVCGQKYANRKADGAFIGCYFEKLTQSTVGTFQLRSCPNKGNADKDGYTQCVEGTEGAALLRASYRLAGKRQLGEDDFLLFVNGMGYRGMNGLKNAVCPLLPHSSDNGKLASLKLCKGFKTDKNVSFTVITDRTGCPLPACRDSRFLNNVRSIFENAYVTEVDWSNAEARELYKKSGATHLPVAISDGDVETASKDQRRIELLKPVKGTHRFIYSHHKGWDPMSEICDDGMDNNFNGKVDCDEDSCKEQMFCQPARERQVDMFVSMPLKSTDVNAVFMMQYLLKYFKNDPSQLAFNIHYVNSDPDSTLPETTIAEAKRRLCIQRAYADKFAYMKYLNCRRYKTDANDWEKCLTPQMSAEDVTSCASGREGEALLTSSYKKAMQHDVPGTPHWVVNSRFPVKSTTSSFSIRTPSEVVGVYCEKNETVEACQDAYASPKPNVAWRFSESAGVYFTKAEITVDQFRHFLSGRPRELDGDFTILGWNGDGPSEIETDSYLPFAGYKKYPMTGVTMKDAAGFCEWIGGRLPTESEWLSEATDNWKRNWPWGNDKIACSHAVIGRDKHSKWPCAGQGYNTVCTKPEGHSKGGLCDMVGNVREIVRADFPNADRVSVVGGGYNSGRDGTGAMFYMAQAYGTGNDMGFRCVKSDAPEPSSNPKFEVACRRLQKLKARDRNFPIPVTLLCKDLETEDPRVVRLSRAHLFLKAGPADDGIEDYGWLGFQTCMPFKEGAMMLAINPVPCRHESNDTLGTIERPVIIYAPENGALSHLDLNNLYLDSNETVRIIGPFDLNNDGSRDYVKLSLSYDSEEYSGEWTGMIQYRNGRIVTVDFSDWLDDEFTLADIGDQTGDGRPDLLFHRSVYGSQCGSGFGWEYNTLTVLAEIRSDGTFDFQSQGAEKWMRDQCPEMPDNLNTVKRVACARVWGVSEGEAEKKIKEVRSEGCNGVNDRLDDYPALLAAAQIRFPVTLEARH